MSGMQPAGHGCCDACRGGEQRLEVTEGPWRRQGIAGLFSWAGLGLCVLARDGCLHAVDPATGGIQLLLSAKVSFTARVEVLKCPGTCPLQDMIVNTVCCRSAPVSHAAAR
jgi:hypothetical protein